MTHGVRAEDIVQRREWFGSNAKERPRLRTVWEIARDVLKDYILQILTVSGVLVVIINMVVESEHRSTGTAYTRRGVAWIDGAAILCSVVVVCLVTTVNDYQKERQFQRLSDTADAERTVLYSALPFFT